MALAFIARSIHERGGACASPGQKYHAADVGGKAQRKETEWGQPEKTTHVAPTEMRFLGLIVPSRGC